MKSYIEFYCKLLVNIRGSKELVVCTKTNASSAKYRLIRITCPCNVYPLHPTLIRGVYKGIHFFSLIFALKHKTDINFFIRKLSFLQP